MDIPKDIMFGPDISTREALAVIDSGARQIALIVDPDGKLLGAVTDGDVRRAILRGVSLEEPVATVMNREPTTIQAEVYTPDHANALMRRRSLRHVPVIDGDGRVVGLHVAEALQKAVSRDNPVVLMAGGMGSRLRPLTENTPKPLLKIGEKPLLETILDSFIAHGFTNFHISVNYKADMVRDYFGDGSRWQVDITYLQESKRMGTAGCLSLMTSPPDKPVIVMNGDLLTKVNFGQLLEYHAQQQAKATMCVREYDFQVPYGVIQTEHNRITAIQEKPVHTFFVNAGIYVLDPQAVAAVPHDTYHDMTDLFQTLIDADQHTTVFPVREYWLDIGRIEDYHRAGAEFHLFSGS